MLIKCQFIKSQLVINSYLFRNVIIFYLKLGTKRWIFWCFSIKDFFLASDYIKVKCLNARFSKNK